MANDVSQYVDFMGTVQFADRPENHRKVGEREALVHSMAVKSFNTGQTVYVSFWEDSFPGFVHPAQNTIVYIGGKLRPGDDKYTNVTATRWKPFSDVIEAIDTRKKN